MMDAWLVLNNSQETCYNVYSTEDRAHKAVELMRARYGDDADFFNPVVVGRLQEGRAFGDGLLVEHLREKHQDMFL